MSTTRASTAGPAAADVVDRLAHPTDADVAAVDAWWRANNYLTVGQIYLMAEPLSSEHIKPRLLGHWGTSPGLALVYAHASRLMHLKWLQEAHHLPWRAPVPSLNILLTSTAWRQEAGAAAAGPAAGDRRSRAGWADRADHGGGLSTLDGGHGRRR